MGRADFESDARYRIEHAAAGGPECQINTGRTGGYGRLHFYAASPDEPPYQCGRSSSELITAGVGVKYV